jgi:UrcA family protein
MSTFITTRAVGSRFKFALLMLMGGLSCAMAVGTASAATVDSDVPSLVVRYNSQTLATDSGVQDLYRRIVRAAKQVCPEILGQDLRSYGRAQQCRAQAVANAINQINNSRLAALYATRLKSG